MKKILSKGSAYKLLVIMAIALVAFSAEVYIPQYYQGLAYAASDEKASSVDGDLVAANTRFAFKIFEELQAEDEGRNIFISPLSISTALAMTLNGAKTSTKEAMAKTLEYDHMDLDAINEGYLNLIGSLENVDNQVSLRVADSIWIDKDFEPKVLQNFTKRITDYYRADVFARGFGDPRTVDEINRWVSEKTNGKIDRMVEEIDPEIVMFLINAIYFKGDWMTKFDASRTSKEDFFLPDKSTVKADMMFVEGSFSYYSTEEFEAVRLPYGRDKIAMYIFLPREDVPLESFIGSLNQIGFDEYLSGFLRPSKLQVRLPKFRLEYGIKRLNDVLTKLGMGVAFDMYAADFDGIASVDLENLFLAFVDHKAVIEVNEQGTEAAAATNVAVAFSSIVPKTLTIDRPFFFVIRDDRSGSILFMGKIVDPTQSVSP